MPEAMIAEQHILALADQHEPNSRSAATAIAQLHQDCQEEYWRRSQTLVDAFVRLPLDLPALVFHQDGSVAEVIPSPPSQRELKIRGLLAHRQEACFRPYLELLAKEFGVPWRTLVVR